MKKIIPIFSLILGILIATLAIAIFKKEEKRKIKIESFDKKVTIELGKYKVKNFKESTDDGINKHQFFNITSEEDFLSFIQKSPYYDSELCFKYNGETFGYLIKDDRLFRYRVGEKTVELSSIGRYLEISGADDYSYNIGLIDIELYAVQPHKYRWHGKLSFEQIKLIVSKLGSNVDEIEESVIIMNVLYGEDYSYRGTKIRIFMDDEDYVVWEYVE